MFAADLTIALLASVGGTMVVLFGLWLYYDRRDRSYYDATRRRSTYHCLKCSHVYTSAMEHEVSRCPRCGHENPRLHF